MGLTNLDIERHLVEHAILNLEGTFLKLDGSNANQTINIQGETLIAGGLSPNSDGSGSIGTSGLRWSLVTAKTIAVQDDTLASFLLVNEAATLAWNIIRDSSHNFKIQERTGITTTDVVTIDSSHTLTTTGNVHIKTGVSGATASTSYDDLVIESDDTAGMTFLSPNNKATLFAFGDPENNVSGFLQYSHTTDDMYLKAINDIILDATNVGVGIGAPLYPLHVDGNIVSSTGAYYGKMGVSGSAFDFGSISNIQCRFIQNNIVRMLLDANGDLIVTNNVGIGETALDTSLDGLEIKPSARAKFPLICTDTDGSRAFTHFLDSSGESQVFIYNVGGTAQIQLNSNGDSYFIGGNVGIGTTSPLTQLELAGSGPSGIAFFDTAGTDSFNIRPSGDTLIFSIDVNHDGSQNINTMVFDDAGKVGIGMTPLHTLDVNGPINSASGEIRLKRDLTDSADRRNWGFITETSAAGDFTIRVSSTNTGQPTTPIMNFLKDGKVGIGTTSPWGKLEVEQISHSSIGENLNLFLSDPGAASNITQIGFGYRNATKAAVAIGHNSTDASGSTKGDFFIATRDSTTDIAPTKRLIVDSSGNIITTDNKYIGLDAFGNFKFVSGITNINSASNIILNLDTNNNDTTSAFRIYRDAADGAGTRLVELMSSANNDSLWLTNDNQAFIQGAASTDYTQKFDGTNELYTCSGLFVFNAKTAMTPIGGYCIKLTNKTGSNSVAGQLVKADTATDDAVILTAAGDVECFGVFLDSGITDGSEAWVVVSGIADVAHDDNVASVRGDWVSTGVLAGYAATAATPAAAPTHFEEIGHCIETVAAGGAGTHILARCVLHFN